MGQKLTGVKWPKFLLNFQKSKKWDSHFVALDLKKKKIKNKKIKKT